MIYLNLPTVEETATTENRKCDVAMADPDWLVSVLAMTGLSFDCLIGASVDAVGPI